MTQNQTTVDAAEQGRIVEVFERVNRLYMEKVRLYAAMNIPAEVLAEILGELNELFVAAHTSFGVAVKAEFMEHYVTSFNEYQPPVSFTNHFSMGNYHSVNHAKI